MVVGSSDEAEKEDESKEDEDERHIGAERAQEEDEADHGHDNGIVALAGVVRLASRAIGAVCSHESVSRVSSVSQVDPMAPIDDEDDKWKCVAKDEFCDTGDVHGNATQEVIRATDADCRGRVGAFELEKTEHRRGIRNKETENTKEGGITCTEPISTRSRARHLNTYLIA